MFKVSPSPTLYYNDRSLDSMRPSYQRDDVFINEEHRMIFEVTKDIPGWQMEADSYKLYELGYYAGDVILEIGTYGGRSAVIELRGALSNPDRLGPPQFFGVDVDRKSIRRTFYMLNRFGVLENAFLFRGTLYQFIHRYQISPTMVFMDANHRYEDIVEDIRQLTTILPAGVPVLFHDFLNSENDTGEYGVRRAVTEWENDGYGTFIGAFGCSALFVSGQRCRGNGNSLSRDEFDQSRHRLFRSYKLMEKNGDKTIIVPEEKRIWSFHDDISLLSRIKTRILHMLRPR